MSQAFRVESPLAASYAPTRRLTRAGLFAMLALISTGVHAADEWTAEKVVDLLRSRERAISTVDVIIREENAPGREYVQFFRALADYGAAYDRMLKADVKPDTVPSAPPPVEWSVWRYCRNASGQSLVEWFDGWKQKPDHTVTRSISFDGAVYEMYVAAQSRVSLQTSASDVPSSSGVIGLDSVGVLDPTHTRSAGLPWSDYLRHAAASRMLSGPRVTVDAECGRCLEFTVREPSERKFPAIEPGALVVETTLLLDLAHGLAPAKSRTAVRLKAGDRYEKVEVGGTRVWLWRSFSEVVPGVWLAKTSQCDAYPTVLLPTSGKDFHWVRSDGRPFDLSQAPDMDAPAPTIDYSHAKVVEFHAGRRSYEVVQLRINEPLTEPICGRTYPAGTLVSDSRTGELFQLTGVSPAVDGALRRALDPVTATPLGEPHKRRVWVYWTIISANVACVVLLILGRWLWKRHRLARL